MSLLFRLLSAGISHQIIDEILSFSTTTHSSLSNKISGFSNVGINAAATSSLGNKGNLRDIFSPSINSSSIFLSNINGFTNIINNINNSINFNNKKICYSELVLDIVKILNIDTKINIEALIENSIISYNLIYGSLLLNREIIETTSLSVDQLSKNIVVENFISSINSYIEEKSGIVKQEMQNFGLSTLDTASISLRLKSELNLSILEILKQKKYYNHIAEIIDLVSESIINAHIVNDGVYYSIRQSESLSQPNLQNETILVYYPETSLSFSTITNEQIIN